MQVIVQGLVTTYVKQGSGKTVLFLHGWGDSSAGTKALQAALASSYTVVALDLPGFGRTDKPHEPWGLDEYVAFVQAFLAKIEVQPYAILGHSNGGAIAIRGLATKKLSAEKLLLLASAGVRLPRKGRSLLLQTLAKAGNVATLSLPKREREKLRKRLYAAAGSDYLVVPGMEETFRKVVGQDVRPDAARLHVPTLLVYGKADQDAPLAYGQLFQAAIQGSKLIAVEDAGHFLHLDQPQIIQEAIQEFLRV